MLLLGKIDHHGIVHGAGEADGQPLRRRAIYAGADQVGIGDDGAAQLHLARDAIDHACAEVQALAQRGVVGFFSDAFDDAADVFGLIGGRDRGGAAFAQGAGSARGGGYIHIGSSLLSLNLVVISDVLS